MDLKTIPISGRSRCGELQAVEFMDRLGVDASTPDRLAASLPYSADDATCGTENELQVVVKGGRGQVDLPRYIEASHYFRNILRRHRRGELPFRAISDLERWLQGDGRDVWDNSWVRFPLRKLGPAARRVFQEDLRCDKTDPDSGPRQDAGRFTIQEGGEELVRAPVSYLLKLALVDAAETAGSPEAEALADHFLSDNTSPETYSLYVAARRGRASLGRAAALEMAVRFLLTQVLVQYAGIRFGLNESGQKVSVYSAPHPPVRQKELADCITDAFYRDLFMNPCLSGWARGEEKHRYMHLCHETLSRAQLNALSRLREAGVIVTNLVVLPGSSNISLANNGVHVSLGSRRMTRARQGTPPLIGKAGEKYFGDLAVKFVEHFLPLFVGAYSAAPYRLDFKDFHPERVLNFLPYELDYTHLRMIWRRWRKKAHIKARLFGVRLTPFGPPLMDTVLAWLLGMRGDFLPDFRLIDYLASVMSTDACAALDGALGNQDRLKKDLAELGVFDARMPVYMLYRQRFFDQMGYSGFEGRFYSLFHSFFGDMAPAVDLQNLITALAFQFIGSGRLTHEHIPDEPMIESERRQIFFGAAIGLPTFFVRTDTGNLFMKLLLERTPGVRLSSRYPGYWRVRQRDYRRALVEFIRREAGPLVEALGLEETLTDLESRLGAPDRFSALGRLTGDVLGRLGAKRPLDADAGEFNRAAEDYYREDLRRRQSEEAYAALEQEAAALAVLQPALIGRTERNHLEKAKTALLRETATLEDLATAIRTIARVAAAGKRAFENGPNEQTTTGEYGHEPDNPPIHRQANR